MTDVDKTDIKATMRSHGICVLIPTYNNAGTLTHVIEDVMEYADDVIVVNDGSNDATGEILESLGQKITVVSYPRNKGKGGALKEGFRAARKAGFKYAITIDSDGQHYAENIVDFVKAIVSNPGALIVGKRDLSNVDINGKSSFANKFSNFWFAVQTGIMLDDTQTGYRAYPLDKLYGLGLLTSRYEAELELLVFAAWHNVRILQIPINVYYPPRALRISHFRPALDFTRISILNTILCAGAICYGVPVKLYKKLFSKEIKQKDFKPFTHKDGTRRDASITLGRLWRSVYGLSFFLFWSLFVFTPYSVVTFKLGKSTEKKRMGLHKRLQKICRYIEEHFPGAVTEYEGIDNETFTTPSLIICNHQSHLDLPVIMATSPRLIFLTNDWVWNSPFFGKIIHEAEFLPVSMGMDVLLPKLKDLVSRGYSIVVFPEGTRSADCSISRFHQGAFHLANELNLHILPMVIHGAGHYLAKKDFMFRRGKITLKALTKVTREELCGLSLLKQSSHFRKLIKTAYAELVTTIEDAEYFKSLVLYRYAYRGRNIVAECKRILKNADTFEINDFKGDKVVILNSGIGAYALWFALVNKHVQVYALEESETLYNIAVGTAGKPANLHFVKPVLASDYHAYKNINTINLKSI